jgi:hypothetical protein
MKTPMKPTVDEKLDNVLGLEAASKESTEVVTQSSQEVSSSGNADKDLEADFEIARKTLHNLIEKGNELTDDANFFAKEKQDARSVEAAAAAQREARDTALALINLHKVKKDITRESQLLSGGDTNITQNAVFVGTTGELLKLTKELNQNGTLADALKAIDVQPDS